MLDQNQNESFRDKVEQFILNPSRWNDIKTFVKHILPENNKKNNVLLIDQADVFLNEDYLG